MKQTLIVAVAVVVSWAGAFGIAVGVQEWRGQTDSPLAMLEIEVLQEQSRAEACQSAVLFWESAQDFTQDRTDDSTRSLFAEIMETMFRICLQPNESAEPALAAE